MLSFKAFFHPECNLCFLHLVLFLIRDISQAAFLPDLLSISDVQIDTKKQLQLQLITYKSVQLQLAIISCSAISIIEFCNLLQSLEGSPFKGEQDVSATIWRRTFRRQKCRRNLFNRVGGKLSPICLFIGWAERSVRL